MLRLPDKVPDFGPGLVQWTEKFDWRFTPDQAASRTGLQMLRWLPSYRGRPDAALLLKPVRRYGIPAKRDWMATIAWCDRVKEYAVECWQASSRDLRYPHVRRIAACFVAVSTGMNPIKCLRFIENGHRPKLITVLCGLGIDCGRKGS